MKGTDRRIEADRNIFTPVWAKVIKVTQMYIDINMEEEY